MAGFDKKKKIIPLKNFLLIIESRGGVIIAALLEAITNDSGLAGLKNYARQTGTRDSQREKRVGVVTYINRYARQNARCQERMVIFMSINSATWI